MLDAPLQALIASIASFLFICLLFIFFYLLCRPPPKPLPHFQTLTLSLPPKPPGEDPLSFSVSSFDPSLSELSMSDLIAATKNFSSDAIIGDGSFGFVYKAVLPSGLTVAVKKLSSDAFHGFREFRAEMETLARIRHPNLAKILGFCVSGRDRILIYEFLHNGCLDEWIHEQQQPPLSWHTRARILCSVAKGLAFLHYDCTPCIIHRDIKASNVLLDSEFEARITDFGLARRVGSEMSHVSTQVAGTMGYIPPEYKEGTSPPATLKGDVYSYGVLMWEVVSGRRPNWPMIGEDGKEVGMVGWARGRVEAGRGMEVVDAMIVGEAREEEVKGVLEVAYMCTEESAKKRPNMKEVVAMLEARINMERIMQRQVSEVS